MAGTEQQNEPVIEVNGVGKRFGRVAALSDLTFAVPRGEILGLLGPNGAGKSTTIHILLGLTTPTCGTVRIFGRELAKHRHEILGRVNFSSVYTSLPSNLTARENLRVFAYLYGIARPGPKIERLLDIFEIPEIADRPTGGLSSGQVTRLNLCKAFLNDPEILFLDEPTASLDPDIADKVRRRLLDLQQEQRVTMIYTSHNMNEVELMCDRVIFIGHGRKIMEGPPREIIAHTNSRSLEDLFISIARDGELYAVNGQGSDRPCGSA